MRNALVAMLVALALPASAAARGPVRTVAPPGNSGVSQYLETIPTAKGNRPSDTVAPVGTNGSGPSGSAPVSSSTQQALDRQGSAGRQAAALADATAPARAGHASPASTASHTKQSVSPGTGTPVAVVLRAVTGSAGQGGLGPLMPALLILIVLGGGVMVLRRRRDS